jgi:hypothetical protein
LDIDKLIQDGDKEQLDDFITPVLFCSCVEFDENKTDPGFIKVFKISQLIGEYLLYCNEKEKEKVISVEKKCLTLEETKGKGDKELKESFILAKKELKMAKEMLAQTQTQFGLNRDEVDQVSQLSQI